MNYAPQLRDLRARFGLTQQELGYWLGLSRVQVARVEAQVDPLPQQARRWVQPWLAALTEVIISSGPVADSLAPATPAALPPDAPVTLQARVATCYYEAARLREQLLAYDAQVRLLHYRLAAGPRLLAALPPLPPEPATESEAIGRRRRWLGRWLEAATDGLLPVHPVTGAAAGILLRARHSAWLHEAAWLEACLARGGT